MKKTLSVVFWVIVAVLCADFIGFCLWALSGQVPVDGFYLGAITTNLIQWLMYH